MLRWVKEMRTTCQYSVLFAVGEQSLQRINTIDEERLKRESRLEQVSTTLQQFKALSYLNPDQRREQRGFQF